MVYLNDGQISIDFYATPKDKISISSNKQLPSLPLQGLHSMHGSAQSRKICTKKTLNTKHHFLQWGYYEQHRNIKLQRATHYQWDFLTNETEPVQDCLYTFGGPLPSYSTISSFDHQKPSADSSCHRSNTRTFSAPSINQLPLSEEPEGPPGSSSSHIYASRAARQLSLWSTYLNVKPVPYWWPQTSSPAIRLESFSMLKTESPVSPPTSFI